MNILPGPGGNPSSPYWLNVLWVPLTVQESLANLVDVQLGKIPSLGGTWGSVQFATNTKGLSTRVEVERTVRFLW